MNQVAQVVRVRPAEGLAVGLVMLIDVKGTRPMDIPVLRSIPGFDKSALCFVGIFLCAQFLDADLCAVLGEDDVLLFEFVDTSLGKLTGVKEDLMARPH